MFGPFLSRRFFLAKVKPEKGKKGGDAKKGLPTVVIVLIETKTKINDRRGDEK